MPEGRSYPGHQFVEIEGFGQIVVGAQVEPADPGRHIAAGGEHDDGGLLIRSSQLGEHGEPVDIRQADVEKDEVGSPLPDRVERRPACGGHLGHVAGAFKPLCHERGHALFVLDHEHSHPITCLR